MGRAGLAPITGFDVTEGREDFLRPDDYRAAGDNRTTGLSSMPDRLRVRDGIALRFGRRAGTPSGAAEGGFRCSRSRGI